MFLRTFWKNLFNFEPLNPDIQESWNLLDLVWFGWFQCVGYLSHSVSVKELDSKFQNSTNPEITWKSGIAKFFAKVNILGINSTYFLPLTMNVTKKLRKCNLFSILDNFLDPKSKKLSRTPKKYFISTLTFDIFLLFHNSVDIMIFPTGWAAFIDQSWSLVLLAIVS